MNRLFTKNATGVAPDGRWYAGDINALQDAVAALTDLTQTHSVGALAVGESGLQLLRYGAGEARLTGAMRMDGIVRALGGLYAGAFTTTQRDAITAGSRPYGLIILNTTTNQYEWNSGTDPAPIWAPLSPPTFSFPVGASMGWSWAAGSIPANTLLEYGQSVLKASYPALDVIASASAYPYGSDATHLSLPDKRGRTSVGKDDMGGTAANRITAAISGVAGTVLGAVFGSEGITLSTAQLPAHNHGITGAPAITGAPGRTGAATLTGTVGFSDPQHRHTVPVGNTGGLNDFATNGNTQTTGGPTDYASTGIVVNNGSLAVSDTIGITAGSLAVNAGTLATANAGSGTVVQNAQPSIIVNSFMRVA